MELNQAIKDSAANGDRVAIAAVVVWLLVTLLKSDYVPIDFAPKVRPWLALILGQAYAVLVEVLINGTPWLAAIIAGLAAGVSSIAGQELLASASKKVTSLMALVFVCLAAVGCSGGFREALTQGLNGTNEALAIAQPCVHEKHARDVAACGPSDDACRQKAKDQFNAFATGNNLFHELFCALSESKDGCDE